MPRPASARSGPLRKIARELKVHGQSLAAGREARSLARRDRPLLVGPWGGEVGFELLYWIPFLRHLLADSPAGRRIVVVSRGGVADWYSDIASEYVELLDFLDPRELQRDMEQRAAARGSEKQTHWTPLDRRAIAVAMEQAGLSDGEADLLHPWTMFRRYRGVWMGRRSLAVVERESTFAPLPGHHPADKGGYLALKAYFSGAFPRTEDNLARVRELVARLATHRAVRVISSGISIDNHVDIDLSDIAGVELVDPGPPNQNLARQTEIVAGADALIATYGGFSYLGPLLGTPAIAFHAGDRFNRVHLDLITATTRALERASPSPETIAYMTLDLRHNHLLDLLATGEAR